MPVATGQDGMLHAEEVAKCTDTDVAVLMVTNPNTLMGVAKPGHMGEDVMHFNLHKTFSTPHGG